MILRAHGSTYPQLFEDAAHQLFALLLDPADVGQALREKVALEATDPEALLLEWLKALIGLAIHQRMVFCQFRVQGLNAQERSPCSLQAEVLGELLDTQRHAFIRPPEQVFVSEVRLRGGPAGYQAEITLGERKD